MGTRSPPSPGDGKLIIRRDVRMICTTLQRLAVYVRRCRFVNRASGVYPINHLNSLQIASKRTSSNSMNGSEKGFASFDHPLKLVDKDRWIATIERLKYGYTSTNGIYFPPAVITANGCQLAQRSLVNDGYIHVPPVTAVTGKARKDVQKKSPILSLRIAWCATWQRVRSMSVIYSTEATKRPTCVINKTASIQIIWSLKHSRLI
ncbi:hypothetical protein V1505DRAFT_111291 [Lipomyces doorenjongii]